MSLVHAVAIERNYGNEPNAAGSAYRHSDKVTFG
jgi:hypothetical protein